MNPCKKGLNGNQFFAHPEDQNKYIQCSQWGQMFIFNCPEGLIWNTQKTACERRFLFSLFQPFAKTTQFPATVANQFPAQPTTRQPSSITTQKFESPIELEPVPTQNTHREFNNQLPSSKSSFVSTVTAIQTLSPLETPELPILPVTPRSRLIETTTTTTTTTPRASTKKLPVSTTTVESSNLEEPTFSSADCSVISISDSTIPIVNGVYTKTNSDIYRRSDNLRIPGLIAHIGPKKWCFTLSFSAHDLNTITAKTVLSLCGANLECCMLISDSKENLDLANPKRDWTVNILDNKGTNDPEIKISCQNIKKSI